MDPAIILILPVPREVLSTLTPAEVHRIATVAMAMGKYLGYPECCVTWFLNNRVIKQIDVDPQQSAVHGDSGFIPCPSCASKVTSETINTLIKDRVCPSPFPEWPFEDRLRFLKTVP